MADQLETEYSLLKTMVRYLARNAKFDFEKPYKLIDIKPTIDVPATNMLFEGHDVSIQDLRFLEHLSLESHGFQLYDWPSKISMDANYSEVQAYCEHMAALLEKELDAEKVFTFRFTV